MNHSIDLDLLLETLAVLNRGSELSFNDHGQMGRLRAECFIAALRLQSAIADAVGAVPISEGDK